jgi:hypothetical protein
MIPPFGMDSLFQRSEIEQVTDQIETEFRMAERYREAPFSSIDLSMPKMMDTKSQNP